MAKSPSKTRSEQVYQRDQINLYGGDLKLFRTTKSGGVWQLKIWIFEEQKYFRKSLRTRDEDFARRKAEDEYIQIKAKRLNGQKVFKVSLHTVIDEWLEIQKETVGLTRTPARWKTIQTQTNWLKEFIPDKNFKIEDLSSRSFVDYYGFRRKRKPEVKNATLINEKCTINAILKYGVQKGYLSPLYRSEFPDIPKNIERRQALSLNEYKKIYRYFGSKEFLKDGDTHQTRDFVRDFTLVLANTGIRFGEARRLKWKHIKIVRGQKVAEKSLVEITLTAEMTKNKKSRIVQGMRGDVFTRIKSYSNYRDANDFVFVDNQSGNQLTRDHYYRCWKLMLKETGLNKEPKEISYYCLRHSYATWRLYAGVNSRALCENLGCGIQYLEQHYGHMETRVMRDKLTGSIDKDLKYLLDE